MANKSLDKRFRAAAVVQFIVLIGLMIYGIRSKRGVWYYVLSIFILSPAAGAVTLAVSGPIVMGENETTKEETTKEEPKV